MPSRTEPAPDLLASVATILERELATLRREVEAYPEDRDLWRQVPGIANVGGTLALHLAGNIQHYFGARLADTGYVRDRPAEFARTNVPRADVVREIESARAAVKAAGGVVTASQLAADFPEVIAGCRVETGDYLVHLAAHFAYHLGQLDYHRRVVTGMNTSLGALRPGDIRSARPAQDQ